MKVEFTYDIDKDVENFTKTLNSVNHKEHTVFHELYIKKHGNDFKSDKIRHFILEYLSSTDLTPILSRIESEWRSIEAEFIERAEKIFGIKYPHQKITAYLTTNNRCSYNTKASYFFVYLHNKKSNNPIIMHELFHFYTWYTFYEEFENGGVSKEKYDDIKESLTELLNIEFADLLNGEVDKGYPQHQEMRNRIREIWATEKDLKKLVQELNKEV